MFECSSDRYIGLEKYSTQVLQYQCIAKKLMPKLNFYRTLAR